LVPSIFQPFAIGSDSRRAWIRHTRQHKCARARGPLDCGLAPAACKPHIEFRDVRRTVCSSTRMVMARVAIVLGLSCAWLACGGHVADVGDAGADGSTGGDASSEAASDAPVVDCNQLFADLGAARAEARTCCPFCNAQQCSHAIDDVCCKISITATSIPAFSELVARYKANCPSACSGAPCARAPSGICDPTNPNDPQSRGICR
jgi:hypothetical protein